MDLELGETDSGNPSVEPQQQMIHLDDLVAPIRYVKYIDYHHSQLVDICIVIIVSVKKTVSNVNILMDQEGPASPAAT